MTAARRIITMIVDMCRPRRLPTQSFRSILETLAKPDSNEDDGQSSFDPPPAYPTGDAAPTAVVAQTPYGADPLPATRHRHPLADVTKSSGS
ncbi:hypothetical protein AB0J90_30650 [Micromonospora sp. NPDC049523]|uniref:hypothetical protein n=1 Tax=Micromonospora sp. NPDC049523 TaxID=3155921 RepID=UPI00341A3CCD